MTYYDKAYCPSIFLPLSVTSFYFFYITRPIGPLFTAFVFGLSKKFAAKIVILALSARKPFIHN